MSNIANLQPKSNLRSQPNSRTFLRSTLRNLRRNPAVALGIVIVIVWILLAVFAPTIATQDPLSQAVSDRLQAPNGQYFMGTDELGRDIFSRVLYGGRITIPAALAVVIIDSLIGTLIGALAGYIGGIWDEILMRLTELYLAFPTIILAMAVTAALGPSIRNAVLALIVVRWPSYARLTRGLILEAKNDDYVKAVRSLGATHTYILVKTLLPNTIAPALVYASLDIGNVILLFAGLSFLGLGPEPSSPEWGRMVSIGIDFFDQTWMWLFPGLAIASLVMAFNFIGDGLRDLLDPRTRK
ncbi:MAG: ABC transporter permease [Ardenticatenaceae bacterium]|nr:ABC transporter permease [Ardenticatenaceae bacterium]